MRDISNEIEDGPRVCGSALLTIGSTLGTAVPQTLDGALVSFVTDLGKDSSKPTVRGIGGLAIAD